jgi:hypothetical protein
VVPFASNLFLYSASTHAFATTRAPRSGVRARIAATSSAIASSVSTPFSTSSSRRLTSISWK